MVNNSSSCLVVLDDVITFGQRIKYVSKWIYASIGLCQCSPHPSIYHFTRMKLSGNFRNQMELQYRWHICHQTSSSRRDSSSFFHCWAGLVSGLSCTLRHLRRKVEKWEWTTLEETLLKASPNRIHRSLSPSNTEDSRIETDNTYSATVNEMSHFAGFSSSTLSTTMRTTTMTATGTWGHHHKSVWFLFASPPPGWWLLPANRVHLIFYLLASCLALGFHFCSLRMNSPEFIVRVVVCNCSSGGGGGGGGNGDCQWTKPWRWRRRRAPIDSHSSH